MKRTSVLMALLLVMATTTCSAASVNPADCQDAIASSYREIEEALDKLEDAIEWIDSSERTRTGHYLLPADYRLDIFSAFHNARSVVDSELRYQVFDNGCRAARR